MHIPPEIVRRVRREQPILTGSENQVEWAERLREQVDLEFDRVAAALSASRANPEFMRRILGLLEEKRIAVMSNERAGYFIRDWQEPAGKVRMLIVRDPRHAPMIASRALAETRNI